MWCEVCGGCSRGFVIRVSRMRNELCVMWYEICGMGYVVCGFSCPLSLVSCLLLTLFTPHSPKTFSSLIPILIPRVQFFCVNLPIEELKVF